MLFNLVSNAVKYTAEGGRILVSASAEGDSAVIRVEDDGVGISPSVLPRIFELLTREERVEDREGYGVGLAAVKHWATLHGGGVEARSPGPGQGSIFCLRLPMKQS